MLNVGSQFAGVLRKPLLKKRRQKIKPDRIFKGLHSKKMVKVQK